MPNETYNNERLDDLARRVFYTALMKADKMIASDVPVSVAELAALADAAANAFNDETDGDI